MKLSKPKHSSWRKMDPYTDLPIYNPNSAIGKRENSKFRSKDKFVHLIPLIVLGCLFILWCLSSPVNLVIKDGRLTAVRQVVILKSPPVTEKVVILRSPPMTERLIDHSILAVSTTPNASIPLVIIMPNNNHTEAAPPQPASESGTLVPSSLLQ